MASHATSPLGVGQVLQIRFPTFTARITVRSQRELTVEIVGGENVGFSDTVATKQSSFARGWSCSHGASTSEARSYTCWISVPVRHTPR
jgi:hypothetical protein